MTVQVQITHTNETVPMQLNIDVWDENRLAEHYVIAPGGVRNVVIHGNREIKITEAPFATPVWEEEEYEIDE